MKTMNEALTWTEPRVQFPDHVPPEETTDEGRRWTRDELIRLFAGIAAVCVLENPGWRRNDFCHHPDFGEVLKVLKNRCQESDLDGFKDAQAEKARELVERFWVNVESLAKALLEHRRLTFKQARDVVGEIQEDVAE